MSRVLVCGGRDYRDDKRVFDVLTTYHVASGITAIIDGGASGADALARRWAETSLVPVETYEADWENQGSFAGPMRNTRMLNEGRPNLVVAFPGGRGTAEMVRKARKAGVTVVEIAP